MNNVEFSVNSIMNLFLDTPTTTEYYEDGTTRDFNKVRDSLLEKSLYLTDSHLEELRKISKGCDKGWTVPEYTSFVLGNYGESYRAINIYSTWTETYYYINKYIKENYQKLGETIDKDYKLTFYMSSTEIVIIASDKYEEKDKKCKIVYLDKKILEKLLQ